MLRFAILKKVYDPEWENLVSVPKEKLYLVLNFKETT